MVRCAMCALNHVLITKSNNNQRTNELRSWAAYLWLIWMMCGAAVMLEMKWMACTSPKIHSAVLNASVGIAIRSETTEFRVNCGRWPMTMFHDVDDGFRASHQIDASAIKTQEFEWNEKGLPVWLTGYYYCINTHLTGIACGCCWTSTSELASIPSSNMRKLNINIERVVQYLMSALRTALDKQKLWCRLEMRLRAYVFAQFKCGTENNTVQIYIILHFNL